MKVCIPKLALRLSRPNQPSDQLGTQVQCRSQKLHKKTCQIFVRCAGFSTPAHLCPLLFCQSLQPPSIVLKFDTSGPKRQKRYTSRPAWLRCISLSRRSPQREREQISRRMQRTKVGYANLTTTQRLQQVATNAGRACGVPHVMYGPISVQIHRKHASLVHL